MNVVERVKQICKEDKIPISRLERYCGFSNGYIRSLKEGMMPADRLLAVAKYLGVSTEYLLTGSETPQEPLSSSERELLHLYRSIPIEKRSELLSYARYLQSTAKKTDSSKAG